MHKLLFSLVILCMGATAKVAAPEEYGRCFQFTKVKECQARCCVFVVPDKSIETDYPATPGCYPVAAFKKGRPIAGTKFARKTRFKTLEATEDQQEPLKIPIASRGCSRKPITDNADQPTV